jgi:hypothetical protein
MQLKRSLIGKGVFPEREKQDVFPAALQGRIYGRSGKTPFQIRLRRTNK